MVHGVTEGWSKTLELVGAGYRAEMEGANLVLKVGYSHPVKIDAPEGITFTINKNHVNSIMDLLLSSCIKAFKRYRKF